MADAYLDMARAALVRALTDEPALKSERRYHNEFIVGYVQALSDAETGDPSKIRVEPARSDAYRRGYSEALADLGIDE